LDLVFQLFDPFMPHFKKFSRELNQDDWGDLVYRLPP
jgi:hypothetical protein